MDGIVGSVAPEGKFIHVDDQADKKSEQIHDKEMNDVETWLEIQTVAINHRLKEIQNAIGKSKKELADAISEIKEVRRKADVAEDQLRKSKENPMLLDHIFHTHRNTLLECNGDTRLQIDLCNDVVNLLVSFYTEPVKMEF